MTSQRYACTAAEVIQYVAWATAGDVVLTRGQLRHWVSRARVQKAGRTSSGENLYVLRTVLDHLKSTGIVFAVPEA